MHKKKLHNIRKSRQLSGRDWVKKQRERHRRRGKEIRPDSRYAGRKRRNFAV